MKKNILLFFALLLFSIPFNRLSAQCNANIDFWYPGSQCPDNYFSFEAQPVGPNCTITWFISTGVISSGQGTQFLEVYVPPNTPEGQLNVDLRVVDNIGGGSLWDNTWVNIRKPHVLLSGPQIYSGACSAGDTITFCVGENLSCVPVPGETRVYYDSVNVSGATIISDVNANNNCFNCVDREITVVTTDPRGFAVYGHSHDWVFCTNIDTFYFRPTWAATPGFNYSLAGNTVTVTDNSVNADSAWYDWGDGSVTPLLTHSYTTGGIYNICQVVQDSCGYLDTLCQSVSIACPAPVAGFSFSSLGLTTTYTNSSTGTSISGYLWDFGDGNTSTSMSPSHTYSAGGTYTTCLTVTDACGTDSSCQSVTVVPTIPPTQLTTAWCGDTLDKLNRLFYADAVSGATNYEFELIDTLNSDTFYIVNGLASPIGNLAWINGPKYNTVYKVRVRAEVSGAFGPWGPVCLLFTAPFPTTQLVTADCGRNLDSLDQIVYLDPLSGASDFEYELTDSASGGVINYLRGSGNLSLKLIWISGIQNGATYFVRVRANVGGVWGPYGPICPLRTPAAGPTTQIRAQYCGITLGSLSDLIRADALPGASNYEYELTDSASGGVLTYLRNSPNTGFRLSWVTGVQMNRTYFIRVRAFLNGAWTAYGTPCTVRTPAIPATQLQAAYCPFIATAWNNLIRVERVSGADGYEYEFTDTSTSGVVTYLRNSSNLALRLSWVTALMQNRVYAVRVRARVSGSFGPFGPVCYVTTPNVPMKWAPGDEPMADLGEGQPELSVYPNPSRGEQVWLRFRNWDAKPVKVALFDVTGKMVWRQDIEMIGTEQQLKIAPGVRLPAGTYLVRVSGNDGSQVRRLVVQ